MTSKLASLHAGLVARKGEARPAVNYPQFAYAEASWPAAQPVRREEEDTHRSSYRPQSPQLQAVGLTSDEELFYGDEDRPVRSAADLLRTKAPPEPVQPTPRPRLAEVPLAQPVVRPVVVENKVAVAEKAAVEEKVAVAEKVVAEEKHEDEAADTPAGPYRLTFRMTADQRRRLRIAAAKKDMSLQKLLSEALDAHLDSLCACALRECTCLAREGETAH